jgi:hypothetical protein
METWERIEILLAPDPKSEARTELAKAAGVACSAISSESPRDSAIVVWGNGPRVRVYCVFGDDAITGDGVDEEPLAKNPTEGHWQMSIPCPPEDVVWSQKKLSTISSRITARSSDDDVPDANTKSEASTLPINLGEFLKP